MRILIGHDGSPASTTARDLVASLPLAAGTLVRLVTVLEDVGALMGAEPANAVVEGWSTAETRALAGHSAALDHAADGFLAAVVRHVARPEVAVLRGRPATALVDEARRWSADLLVIGSRGHGAESGIMGSVANEVIDQASVPVLVARRETARRVLLAHDGSAHADHALERVASWPLFADADLRILSVAHVTALQRLGIAGTAEEAPARSSARRARQRPSATTNAEEQLVDAHRDIADAACQRLLELGRFAEPRVALGRPITEIVAMADAWADLVVVGSRGRTGLVRLLLGSVARGVLQQAATSVLVVR
jgi:nucleotide-binding universal stress UspA family protein